ncbi:sister chromatid cohesion protein dcc1-related [Anaeramoeba flamelloides]|uniref:Sister chromatid cohesion protein dcc1-related n=1 Tax=Anaeramoeba flamelloides TaxID=1746091 RepID=A0ABQ8YAT1_9EUKA|nr:sister chromatid cohesion protein dcc1-related [Anaeramoeba flamelloides]
MTQQTINYSNTFSSEQYLMIELPTEITLTENEELFFKGNQKDSAVLCTNNQTFEIKKALSSNTLYFLNEKGNVIESQTDHYLEVLPMIADFHSIYLLLSEIPYSGKENEKKISFKELSTFEQLLDQMQSSRNELKKYLKSINAFRLNGYIRIMDSELQGNIIDLILAIVEEQGWDIDHIPFSELTELLKQIKLIEKETKYIFIPCINRIGEWNDLENEIDIETEISQENEMLFKEFRLNKEKVIFFRAQRLIETDPDKKWKKNDFFTYFNELLPSKIELDEQILGKCVIEKEFIDSKIEDFPTTLIFLDHNLFPTNPRKRLEKLFQIKPRWRLNEIKPFLEHVCDANEILSKYSRKCTSMAGTVYYIKK